VARTAVCGDRRVRTLLYEAANVVLTRYKGQLKLKGRGLRDRQTSTMRKARREELRSVPQHRMHDDCEATPQSDANRPSYH
jgi:hypothetical protein